MNKRKPIDKMKAVHCAIVGDAGVLQVEEVEKPTMGVDEVLIEIAAAAVNLTDLHKQSNFYQFELPRPHLGLEGSGRIVAVGLKVTRWKIGDEVCGIFSGGGYAELVAVHATHIIPIPRGIALREAAALPLSACLIWSCFFKLRRICVGQTVLIHRAAGGVGSIAIQILKYCGCHVLATSGTQKKVEFCKALGAEVSINYTKENFSKRVLDETEGKGVDYILDNYGEGFLEKNLQSLAIGGTLIIIGFGNDAPVDLDLEVLAAKTISITGCNTLSVDHETNVNLLNDVEKHIWPAIAQQHIKPIIYRCFEFDEALDAHEAMKEGINLGKILLVP